MDPNNDLERPTTPPTWDLTTFAQPDEPPSAPAPASAATSDSPPSRPSRRSGLVAVVAAAVLAAVLSSGGTYAALQLTSSGPAATPAATARAAATQAPLGTATSVATAGQDAIVQASAKASPSVVTITTSTTQTAYTPFGPQALQETGVGSGIIFDSNGWILTNRHVVSGSSTVTVELSDGRQLTGRVYGTATNTDLAVVKVDATGLPALTIGDSSQLQIGQTVIAIGSPLGQFTDSVTTGIVSALNRAIDASGEHLSGLIQTDAPINPGNSGGPLLDTLGRVVGVNTATAGSAQGIAFSIPINVAKPFMAAALAGQPLP